MAPAADIGVDRLPSASRVPIRSELLGAMLQRSLPAPLPASPDKLSDGKGIAFGRDVLNIPLGVGMGNIPLGGGTGNEALSRPESSAGESSGPGANGGAQILSQNLL